MTTVLAIDQGTSGTKAAVVDSDEGILGIAEVPLQPSYLPGGGVEQDPAALLASVLDAGRRAMESAGRTVQAVSLANQGETVLAWDPSTGRPLSPAVVWQDRRAESVTADVAHSAGWVAQRTGLVLDPYFSAPKLAWLRRHRTQEGVVTTTDAWLVHQLCGAFVTDASTASRSLLTGLDDIAWDHELLQLFGLQDEQLPLIVDCDATVGETSAFGAAVPVAGLVVDQQAALLAEGCTTPGAAKCTFGTGAFLLANTGMSALRSTAGLTASAAWRVRGETAYCLDGQVYAAGSAVRWLVRLGLAAGPADMDALVPEDAGRVLAVPSLAGLAAPWWRPEATASFSGLSLDTEPGHLVLAVLQGIAAQVAQIATLVAIDLGAPLHRLRVDGGLTQSRTLMQSVADLLQLPVDVYPSGHATVLGAAAMGALALDPDLALEDAVPMWSAAQVYEPRWSPDRSAEFLARWGKAVDEAQP